MKLANFFIASTTVNAAAVRRSADENDCLVKTADGKCLKSSMTLGDLPPALWALLAGGDNKDLLPLVALSQAGEGTNNGLLTTLALTGGDDLSDSILPLALASQANSDDNGLLTATVLSGDNNGLGNNGLATAALLSGGDLGANPLLTAAALGGDMKSNLPLIVASQGGLDNNLALPLLMSGGDMSGQLPLMMAASSNNPAAVGIALATADPAKVTPQMAAVLGGASPSVAMALGANKGAGLDEKTLGYVAANENNVNPLSFHLLNNRLTAAGNPNAAATSLLANKVNDPMATYALTKDPTYALLTAAASGQDTSSLLPYLFADNTGATGTINPASLALMAAGNGGVVNPAAVALMGGSSNPQLQVALAGMSGQVSPLTGAYIGQSDPTKVTDKLIASQIKDPAVGYHASGGDLTLTRLNRGPEFINNNLGLAVQSVEAAATSKKPFQTYFQTGNPISYLASKDTKPALAVSSAATGNPMFTYALTENPILAMMAGQQGNTLPEPIKVDPATGLIASKAPGSLGFALTGDSNYLMMDRFATEPELALSAAYNHPAPTQQDLWHTYLAQNPRTAYGLTGNPMLSQFAGTDDARNMAISQTMDPWTAYAVFKDPRMLFASSTVNPMQTLAAMNTKNNLAAYALTNNPIMLMGNDLFQT